MQSLDPPPFRFTSRHFYRCLAAVALSAEFFMGGNAFAMMWCFAGFLTCLVAAHDLPLESAVGMLHAAWENRHQQASRMPVPVMPPLAQPPPESKGQKPRELTTIEPAPRAKRAKPKDAA